MTELTIRNLQKRKENLEKRETVIVTIKFIYLLRNNGFIPLV